MNIVDACIVKLNIDMQSIAKGIVNDPLIRIDALWGIPLRGAMNVSISKDIKPVVVRGSFARSKFIDVITNLSHMEGQCSHETVRSPGAVGVSVGLLNDIRAINTQKSELDRMLADYSNIARKELWARYPSIVVLQLLRSIVILESPIKIRYYWQQSTSIQKAPCITFIERLQKNLGNIKYKPQENRIAQEKLLLDQLDFLYGISPWENIAYCRITMPSIRARVVEGSGTAKIVTASMPLIYSIENPPPKISPLKNSLFYLSPVEKYRKEHVRSHLECEPIVPNSLIFRYTEKFRSSAVF